MACPIREEAGWLSQIEITLTSPSAAAEVSAWDSAFVVSGACDAVVSVFAPPPHPAHATAIPAATIAATNFFIPSTSNMYFCVYL